MAMAGESTGNNTAYSDGYFGGKNRRKVGLVYDETMCKHHTPTGEGHAECPDRIRVIWKTLQRAGVTQRCVVLGSRRGEDKHLQLVHSKDHVDLVKNLSTKQKDNRRNKIASKLNSIYLNGGSSEAAYLAAGSVVEVTKKVAEGELDCGFAIVRPPGHHAEENKPMGYCLFNNVAVAASYLLNERPDLGIKKILIVDWDVHHGNGTQKMFWKDPRVLCFSIHKHEYGSFYPAGNDGYYDMVGEGPGEGFNINVPWEQGRCGDADYFAAWDHILLPVAKEFKPDIILLSAGFDAAINDPLGGYLVTPYGYSVMLMKLMEFAQGKIVMALEGGYNLDSIAKSSLACVQVLLEQKPIEGSCEAYPVESTWRVIQAVRKRLCAYWPSLANELSSKLIYQKSSTPVIIPSSVSDSVTEDYAHGCLDQVSKSNIGRSARSGARCSSGPRVASSEDPVVDSGSGGELPRPSSDVRDASKLNKRPADEVIDDATENTKRSRVRGAGCEQCPAYSINNGLLPSVTNKLACANFIRSINGSGPEIPKVSGLAVSDLYQEFASSMVQILKKHKKSNCEVCGSHVSDQSLIKCVKCRDTPKHSYCARDWNCAPEEWICDKCNSLIPILEDPNESDQAASSSSSTNPVDNVGVHQTNDSCNESDTSRTNQVASSSPTNQAVDNEVVQQKTTSDFCDEISATNPPSQTHPRPAVEEASSPMKKQKKSDYDAHSDSESAKLLLQTNVRM